MDWLTLFHRYMCLLVMISQLEQEVVTATNTTIPAATASAAGTPASVPNDGPAPIAPALLTPSQAPALFPAMFCPLPAGSAVLRPPVSGPPPLHGSVLAPSPAPASDSGLSPGPWGGHHGQNT